MRPIIITRGAGDIATGTLARLHRAGYRVLALETEAPTAIRRTVSFSEAVYQGAWTIEDMTAIRVETLEDIQKAWRKKQVPVAVDPSGDLIQDLDPLAVVDLILAKKNLGTSMDMAPLVMGVGPGFTAGQDVHCVIESNRGHNLGRVLYEGSAAPNTGIPGTIAGVSADRVIRAPHAGLMTSDRKIGDSIEKGQTLLQVEGAPVPAPISGLIRGLLRPGTRVPEGFKLADIDPRADQYENCFTISDKARAIGGGVLEAICRFQSFGSL